MTETTPRRILIVDDQQEIHDTFGRIFGEERANDSALDDFESRFLEEGGDDQADGAEDVSTIQYSLEHVNSGERAVEAVQESVDAKLEYSVAFVDMRMPMGMDGMETAEQLWKIDPSLHVIICTAYSDHVWRKVVDRLGHNDQLLLLKKPFEADEARQLALALSEKSRLAAVQQKRVYDLGREVERRRDAEETMRVMAHQDALTKLPNRPYLLEKLTKIVAQYGEDSVPQNAVLFLDLDNFKIINDSLGHDTGDELLNQVASRLRECVRTQDTTSRVTNKKGAKKGPKIGVKKGETVRLGGDEFVVLLERLANPYDALVVAQRIVARISEPFSIDDRLVNIGTSVGVAYICDRIKDAHEALRNADTAMYRAKNSGKGRVAVFDQSMHEEVVSRMELENELRSAINDGAFSLNYQPIVDLERGIIQGVEVLIRWTSKDGQVVSPMKFVPIMEEIGLISRVGEWVLESSMRDYTHLMAQIVEEQDRSFYLGVNVSRRQLSDPFFCERLEEILERTGFDRRRLKLEMNESTDSRNCEQALNTMIDLHAAGVGIQIDDFGKGQSSLTCFQDYPIEAVKIDRSFTSSIASDHGHAVITQAIVELAHHLGAKIVAEGVESINQLNALRAYGCDAAQGYLFSPPLTREALGVLLRDPMQSMGIKMLRDGKQPIVVTETTSLEQTIPGGSPIQTD
jgi:predicted signal transduction protein with EAL and GGDEF domain